MSTAASGLGRTRRLARDKNGLYTTTAGRRRRGKRLMPESILEIAENREDAIRLLRKYRYIT